MKHSYRKYVLIEHWNNAGGGGVSTYVSTADAWVEAVNTGSSAMTQASVVNIRVSLITLASLATFTLLIQSLSNW